LATALLTISASRGAVITSSGRRWLWSALYLQPRRSTGLLSAQAEYQVRILPALAAQLMTETSSCGHARHRLHGPGQPWSAS
jgi:hypothetical protein